MLCDERIRSLALRQPDSPPGPDVRRAELIRMSGCPAHPGFRELHFAVAGKPWSWCFPPAGPTGEAAGRPSTLAGTQAGLVLRPGPHGLLAEPAAAAGQPAGQTAGQTAERIDLAAAADLALSGTTVFVHCSLLRQGDVDDGQAGLLPATAGEGTGK